MITKIFNKIIIIILINLSLYNILCQMNIYRFLHLKHCYYIYYILGITQFFGLLVAVIILISFLIFRSLIIFLILKPLCTDCTLGVSSNRYPRHKLLYALNWFHYSMAIIGAVLALTICALQSEFI